MPFSRPVSRQAWGLPAAIVGWRPCGPHHLHRRKGRRPGGGGLFAAGWGCGNQPYFVSFLAIISGLLSENAIANIQAQGTRFFGQAAAQGQSRWTRRDVTSELQQAKIEMAELAQYFGESEEKTAAMVKGEAR